MGRSLRPPQTGIGRYTRNLVSEMSLLLGPDNLNLFLTREVRSATDFAATTVVCPAPTPHEAFRAVWEHTLVPIEAVRRGIDVYHSPNYTLPFKLPCPAVVTVHDLAFLDKRFHNRRLQFYLRALTGASLRKAARIIAVSEYTKQQIEACYPETQGRVSVVYPGLEESFASDLRLCHAERLHPRPYVLFVGSVEPRKNLPRAIRAFERAMEDTGLSHDLVLCGPLGWRYGASLRAIEESRLAERIHRIGYVSEADLPRWYAGADLLLYPSLDEGFGFPVLEAMAAGTPVVSSNCTAIPEVGGDAPQLVPPKDTGAIADAISRVLTQPDLAAQMRKRGRERAVRFTWERAARQTMTEYEKALGS
jgi:glycosyltransferase involved in cell wall biosynthesis